MYKYDEVISFIQNNFILVTYLEWKVSKLENSSTNGFKKFFENFDTDLSFFF